MSILLAVLSLAQVKAGPLDAFRANYASIRVSTEFTYRASTITRNELVEGKLWEPGEHGTEAKAVVTGRWDCDGEAEHTICSSTLARKPTRAGEVVPGRPAVEVLTDGSMIAYHELGDDAFSIQAAAKGDEGLLDYGPFFFFLERFPRNITRIFGKDAAPIRKKSLRGGRPCEVEIYELGDDENRFRIEVAYDPALGYLPRFVRQISLNTATPNGAMAIVSEMYLAEARMCGSGGFVPAEWYTARFDVDDFRKSYPNYDDETILKPSRAIVALGRFHVDKFDDRKAPACLDQLKEAVAVAGVGGEVPLRNRPTTLTLDDIRALLGRKLTDPKKAVMPNIDLSELHEFDEPARRGWGTWLAAGFIACALAAVGRRTWRRQRSPSIGLSLLLAFPLTFAGCGHSSSPIVRLSASFTETRFVYDAAEPVLTLTLMARNTGTQPLKIFRVSAGCSCRRVDHSKLPAVIPPGENLRLSTQIQNRADSSPQTFNFQFDTDCGPLMAPATLYALPNHQFYPASVTLNGLYEGEDASCDLVHREVKAGRPVQGVRLQFPATFTAQLTRQSEGPVAGAPELTYKETAYHLIVKDRGLGLHKELITLMDAGGRKITEVPVVWNRSDFLSSVPDRVILGKRPVRVFLRCPDPTVELERILSSPGGVRAVIASPREITVTTVDGCPAVIDGVIEVQTNAKGRGPLRVQTVRYTPGASERLSSLAREGGPPQIP